MRYQTEMTREELCNLARVESQPAVPTLEQIPTLLEALGNPDIPDEIAELLITLNGRKGQPGAAWFQREIVGKQKQGRLVVAPGQGEDRTASILDITAAATDAARDWHGWGTALKPAHEPIVVARRPMIGTTSVNVQEHGTGAINVEGCRIDGAQPLRASTGANSICGMFGLGSRSPAGLGVGRWPANVILDEEAGAMLDEQTGNIPGGGNPPSRRGMGYHGADGEASCTVTRGPDSGGASRFFYCPKASRADRDQGLDHLSNNHPTVKPVELMRWLIRLVTPPGGTVLDPFLGSGTTLLAAKREGVVAIGIEREPEYIEIAKARIARVEYELREAARQQSLDL